MRKNNKNPQILPPSILIHQQQHTFKQVIDSVDEKQNPYHISFCENCFCLKIYIFSFLVQIIIFFIEYFF
jgi:hypothetical protein